MIQSQNGLWWVFTWVNIKLFLTNEHSYRWVLHMGLLNRWVLITVAIPRWVFVFSTRFLYRYTCLTDISYNKWWAFPTDGFTCGILTNTLQICFSRWVLLKDVFTSRYFWHIASQLLSNPMRNLRNRISTHIGFLLTDGFTLTDWFLGTDGFHWHTDQEMFSLRAYSHQTKVKAKTKVKKTKEQS